MNGGHDLLLNGRRARAVAGGLACAALAGLLSACVDAPLTRARIDPSSPIAPEAAKVLAAKRPYPKFSQIPPAPKNVRPARAYAAAANDAKGAAAKLERETAPETWTLSNTETFAGAAQRQAGAEPAPARNEDTEGFAKSLRERATPPPPPR
jgi:hypothetical protein